MSIALNDAASVSLHLHSLGYGAALQAVAPGEVSGGKQTINLTREGGVHEWYVNGPDGLEQGFTLAESPGARHPGVPLRLALQVNEGWRAVASEDGKRVALRGAGAVVEYGKLVASDSEGRNIPARLTVTNEHVVIEAEDHDAAYPLMIDPLFTFQQRLLAADGAARDRFGAALALSGDTVVIGAPMNDVTQLDQGSVYVFVRSGATQPVWTQRQKLTAGDGMAGDRFGSAVALGGGTLVVGAPNDVTGSGVELGSASVFAFTGSWVPQEILTTGSGAANEIFAAAVVLSNDTVMAGAPGSDTLTQLNRGSVYAFVRPACPALTPAPASLPDGASGASYQQQITISGGAGPFQFWLGGGALPPGLNLAQNGLLSGTPTTQGTYQFTIRATDLSSFCVAGRAYTLTIAPPCSRLRFNPPTLSHGKTGTAYSETLAVKGGAAPYQFSVTGALPAGLSLSASGVLGGTPTQAGSFSFTVLVRDANGCTGSRSYTISIS